MASNLASSTWLAGSSPLTPLPSLKSPSSVPSAAAAQDASQLAPTELATSSLCQSAYLASNSSFIASGSSLWFDSPTFGPPRRRAPTLPAPTPQPVVGLNPPSRPTFGPAAAFSLAGQLDDAYLRYQAALDAIAAKYADVQSDDDGVEEHICVGDLVDRFTRRLVKDEPSDDDGQGWDGLQSDGSEADEVDEVESNTLDYQEEEDRQLMQSGRGSKRPHDNEGLFKQGSVPVWCWVEQDTPSAPAAALPSSSLVFTLLLQHSASLTASVAHATHILLALPPGLAPPDDRLSALHRTILADKKAGQRILSSGWVSDCVRTGVRLREDAYEIVLGPTLPRPIGNTPSLERHRAEKRKTPHGLSRLKVFFSAPDRLGRPPSAASQGQATHLEPAKDAFPIPASRFILAAPSRPPLHQTLIPAQSPAGPSAVPASAQAKAEARFPGPLPLSAKAAGKQRATPTERTTAQDANPATRRRAPTRLLGAGLSKKSRIPKLLSQIRPPPPAPPAPTSRVKREREPDDNDADGGAMMLTSVGEERSECYG